MALVEVNWDPTRRQLRQFGVACLIALPLVGWFWEAGPTALAGLAAAGVALAAVGLVRPQLMKPLFLALSLAAIPIGVVIGELALLVIYFGLFLPIGMIFRLRRRDALQIKLDRRATTYWQPKPQPRGPASYYRQS